MTRSTDSRRARNSASLTIGARRRPASRPSRRRCFLASSRVEPETAVISSSAVRGLRTRVTVFCRVVAARRRRRRRRDGDGGGARACPSPRRRSSSLVAPRRRPCVVGRRRRRWRRVRRPSSAGSAGRSSPSSPAVAGLAAAAAAAAATAATAALGASASSSDSSAASSASASASGLARRRRASAASVGVAGVLGSSASSSASSAAAVGSGRPRRRRPAAGRGAWAAGASAAVGGGLGVGGRARPSARRRRSAGAGRALRVRRRGVWSTRAPGTAPWRRPRRPRPAPRRPRRRARRAPRRRPRRGVSAGGLGGLLRRGLLGGGAFLAAAFLARPSSPGASARPASAGASASVAVGGGLGGERLVARRRPSSPAVLRAVVFLAAAFLAGARLGGGLLRRRPCLAGRRAARVAGSAARCASEVVGWVVVVGHVLLLGPVHSAPGGRRRGPQAQGRRRKAFGGGDTLRGASLESGRHLPRSPGLRLAVAVTDSPGRVAVWRRRASTVPTPERDRRERRRVDVRTACRTVVDHGEYRTPPTGPAMRERAAGRRSRRSPRRAGPARAGSAAAPRPASRPADRRAARSARRRAGRPGTVCRSTRSSARAAASSRRATASDSTARAASNSRSPFLVIRSHQHLVGGEERRDRGVGDRRRARRASMRQRLASSRSASEPPGRLDDLERRRGRRAAPRRARRATSAGSTTSASADLEVLRLAGRPGRRRAGVGDPRVRVEARGVGHRHPGPEDRPLEGPAEVAVAGEAQPAALGVADPEPLDRRGLLLGLLTHRARLACAGHGPGLAATLHGRATGRRCRPGRRRARR